MIVTVDEVKTHLRIQHDEEDAYLTGLIVQARMGSPPLPRRWKRKSPARRRAEKRMRT